MVSWRILSHCSPSVKLTWSATRRSTWAAASENSSRVCPSRRAYRRALSATYFPSLAAISSSVAGGRVARAAGRITPSPGSGPGTGIGGRGRWGHTSSGLSITAACLASDPCNSHS